MTRDELILQRLEELIEKEIPNYERKIKQNSGLMKFLNFFAKIFNKYFMTAYITTVYPKVYFPKIKGENAHGVWKVLTHEFKHLWNAKKTTPFIHGLLYFFPQWLAMLSIFALGAIWGSGWWLLSLLCLGFLTPLPAYFRMNEERSAYRMSMANNLWLHGDIKDWQIDNISENFYGSDYYYMWPFRKDIIKKLRQDKKDLIDGKYDNVFPYNAVKKIIEETK